MKSTTFERELLTLLLKHREGLSINQLAKELKKHPQQLYEKLRKWEKRSIISKINGIPAIYKITNKEIKKIHYYKVKCPFCETISLADDDQYYKICPNKECVTKKGNKRKFWIKDKYIEEVITYLI